MSALAITPAGLLTGFGVAAALLAMLWAAFAWRRRSRRRSEEDDLVIDLTYLERAVEADKQAVTRRDAEKKPLFSDSGPASDRRHRLPTEER